MARHPGVLLACGAAGLTATPKRKENADTYAYFGKPVYEYSLKDGINDGFLTPFKVKQISTTLDEYVYTADDSVVDGEIETGKRYTEKDFNKVIQIKEREEHRVKLLMAQLDPREKTLVFCASQLHALAIRDLINQCKQSRDPTTATASLPTTASWASSTCATFKTTKRPCPPSLLRRKSCPPGWMRTTSATSCFCAR